LLQSNLYAGPRARRGPRGLALSARQSLAIYTRFCDALREARVAPTRVAMALIERHHVEHLVSAGLRPGYANT
jgi:hypothetical protein